MSKLRIKRTGNRLYKYGGGRKTLVKSAEYTVFQGADIVAVIINNGRGWLACQPSGTSKIGSAISPIGLNKYRVIRTWVFDYLTNNCEEIL